MLKTLCALILQDRASDVELILCELRRAGVEVRWRQVRTEAEYLAHLDPTWDVILADYSLPQFTAFQALQLLQKRELDIPFIIVTDSVGEEVAVECMRQGAADYLLKDRLARLRPAIEQALERKRLRAERRQAIEALVKSEWEKAAILDAMSELVAYHDMEMRILWANRAAGESVGLPPEQLVGRYCYEIWGEGDRPCPGCPVEKALLTGQPQSTEITHADGRTWLIRGYPIKDAEGKIGGLVEVTLEITERKRAEQVLWQTKLVVEHSPVVLFRSRAEEGWPIDFVSENVRQFGYSAEELLSGAVPYASLVHPDDLPRMAQEIRDFIARGEDAFRQEYRFLTKDGQVRWVDDRTMAVRGPDGRITHYQGIILDITERKRLEEQFLQAQKMESVGRLAGGIAHDFNNLLTVINVYSDLALRDLRPEDPLRRDMEEIHKAGERAAQLTRQLLAFSRRQVLEMRPLNLNAVLQGLAKMLARILGEDVVLDMKLAPNLWPTYADAGQIEQVVINLAVNARDAMPDGGRLIVETQNTTLDQAYVRQHADVAPGDYIVLSVSDTGLGMTEEVKAHLFEPFFTTKEVGKGTGLGLATVYGIVKQHQGHIWVYSEPGRGSTFKIYLPRAKEEPATVAHAEEAVPLPRGTETVLVVEDDRAVRGVAVRTLKELGYQVLEATNGLEALRVAANYGRTIHLLLTDVVMPGMDGKKLAEHLSASHSGLKVLFVSGYTDEAISQRGVLEKGVAFLQKPFTPAGLACKVREVLEQ